MGYKIKNPDKFREYVRKAGFTQSMLSDYLGINSSYLSAITTQHRNAGKSLANFISRAVNVDLEDIFLDMSVAKKETDTNFYNAKSVNKMTTKKEREEWKSLKQETTKQ